MFRYIKIMIRIFSVFLFLVSFNLHAIQAQDLTASMEAWSGLLDKPKLAEFFSGIFENMGIRVLETGEEFTVHHLGASFSLSPGINEAEVDYIVEVKLENIQGLVDYGADEEIDRLEAYNIVEVIFTPLTRTSLKNPVMSNGFLRWLSGVENLIHIYLISPDESRVKAHSLIFINDEWLVIEELYGVAKRTYRLDVEQALLYQRKVFEATREDTMGVWWDFANWYREWREGVSTTGNN